MPETILFVFAGRKPNLEIAVPFYQRLTEQSPDLQVHVWDLARNPQDSEYIRSISGERITVRTEFYDPPYTQRGQGRVWRHYAQPGYQDAVFVKADDDVVFLDTARFPELVEAATDNSGTVVSALTINNGASTRLIPELWAGFEKLNIPLLDVHLSAGFAEMCHRWFFAHWRENRSPKLSPTQDWVSINLIAFTWETCQQIVYRMRTITSGEIAGRMFGRHQPGDEGAANMLPRLIHEGFTAAHLYFGPQAEQMDDGLLAELRKHYADIARQYLCR